MLSSHCITCRELRQAHGSPVRVIVWEVPGALSGRRWANAPDGRANLYAALHAGRRDGARSRGFHGRKPG